MNKIALFTISPSSIIGLLIAAVTRCPFSHAAIRIDGTWYHASESTGEFSEMDVSKFKNRHCTIFSFDGHLGEWLKGMIGKKYDWQGVRGWMRRIVGLKYKADDRKFYCFEAALNGLLTARLRGLVDIETGPYLGFIGSQIDIAITKLFDDNVGEDFDVKTALCFTDSGMTEERKKSYTSRYIQDAASLITAKPVTGCMIANLFPVGRTGRFGDLS